MSADILSKLKTLHDDVRARIEATPDFKAMRAVERAIGELSDVLGACRRTGGGSSPRGGGGRCGTGSRAVEASAIAEAPAEAASEEAAPEATIEEVVEAAS